MAEKNETLTGKCLGGKIEQIKMENALRNHYDVQYIYKLIVINP